MRGRKSRRRTPKRFISVRRLQWMAICVVVGLFVWLAMPRSPKIAPWKAVLDNKSSASAFNVSPFATKRMLSPTANVERPVRVVFRYSVIPGGAKSVEELKNAIANDPVVSAHYSTFRLSHARIIQLDRDLSMHVSYRVGSKVYWTKRKLKLKKGETLITDGVQSARTRCGNMISDTASEPLIVNEPTVQELDEPQGSSDPEIPIVGNFPYASSLAEIRGSIVPSAEADLPSEGNGNYPHVFLGPQGPPRADLPPTPPSTTHVTSVPEPSALLLLSIGLVAIVILHGRRVRLSPFES